MRHRLSHSQPSNIQEGSKDVNLNIPAMTLSTLVSMIAIAKWVVCDNDAMINPGFRRAVGFMEQLVFEQSHENGGADEIWKNPQDATYHHPAFPEQDGDAWKALEAFNEEMFSIKLIEMAAGILAEREEVAGDLKEQRFEHYEHLMQGIVEESGNEGLVRALLG